MKLILHVEYDESALDAHVRSCYDEGEEIPGEPRPGRALLLSLVEEAKADGDDEVRPIFPPHGRGEISAFVTTL